MAAQRTFTASIEGVGRFVFRHRTLREEIAIGAALERMTEGQEVSDGFRQLTYMLAALEVLTVETPDDGRWDPMTMDPLDPDTFERIGTVYRGMRDAEERFRTGAIKQPQGAGTHAG